MLQFGPLKIVFLYVEGIHNVQIYLTDIQSEALLILLLGFAQHLPLLGHGRNCPYISVLFTHTHTHVFCCPFFCSDNFIMQEHDRGSILPAMIQHYEKARECIDINYYGTKRMCAAFIPLLQLSKSPKIVNLSSNYGLLRVRKTIHKRLKKCTFLNF